MPSLADWLRDWRRIAERVSPGHYDSITTERDGREYEILRISAYDAEIDGDRQAVRTGARAFDDKTALYTHLTRDTGVIRHITMRGQLRYVLEPGSDSVEWAADVEGVSVRELAHAVRDGVLGREVARIVRRGVRASREMAEAQEMALRQRVRSAEAEVRTLRAQLSASEAERGRRWPD